MTAGEAKALLADHMFTLALCRGSDGKLVPAAQQAMADAVAFAQDGHALRQGMESVEFSEGFTGIKPDKLGHKRKYVNGREVPMDRSTIDQDRSKSPQVTHEPPSDSGALRKAVGEEGKDPGTWAKIKEHAVKVATSIGPKINDLAFKLGVLAPDIFDVAADYSKITYLSRGDTFGHSHDAFLNAGLPFGANTVAVILSHAIPKAFALARRTVGFEEGQPLSFKVMAQLTAELLNTAMDSIVPNGPRADAAVLEDMLRKKLGSRS